MAQQPPSGPFDELAAMLVVPAQSGFYLAKSEIIMLANLEQGSLRVNERKRMLADVLKSPSDLLGLVAVVERLMVLIDLHLQRYDDLEAEFPALQTSLVPWRERAAVTRKHLVVLCEDWREEAGW